MENTVFSSIPARRGGLFAPQAQPSCVTRTARRSSLNVRGPDAPTKIRAAAQSGGGIVSARRSLTQNAARIKRPAAAQAARRLEPRAGSATYSCSSRPLAQTPRGLGDLQPFKSLIYPWSRSTRAAVNNCGVQVRKYPFRKYPLRSQARMRPG